MCLNLLKVFVVLAIGIAVDHVRALEFPQPRITIGEATREAAVPFVPPKAGIATEGWEKLRREIRKRPGETKPEELEVAAGEVVETKTPQAATEATEGIIETEGPHVAVETAESFRTEQPQAGGTVEEVGAPAGKAKKLWQRAFTKVKAINRFKRAREQRISLEKVPSTAETPGEVEESPIAAEGLHGRGGITTGKAAAIEPPTVASQSRIIVT
ncbi:MAG: hypothetical protein MHM6MM_001621 [Cercozoa sp. M6MM]